MRAEEEAYIDDDNGPSCGREARREDAGRAEADESGGTDTAESDEEPAERDHVMTEVPVRAHTED